MDRKIDVDDVAISVGSAAASVGLTPATLRTWDRRYGLSPSMRTEGGHRRYGHADLLRLRLAARFIQTGLPPAGAVAAVAGWSDDECRKREGAYGQSLMFWRARGPLTDSGAKQSENDSEPNEPERTRAGGGRTVPMPDATEKQRGMARAAMSLDGDRVREMMSTAIADSGTIAAWNDLAAPTLIALGEKWAQTGEDIEVEHVATLSFQQALQQSRGPVDGGRPVLLANAPRDRHVLPMLALRAALLEHGTNAVMLGAELPSSALVAAVERVRPRAIVIWASMPEHADVAVLSVLPNQRPPAKVFIAGQGWTGLEVSSEVAKPLGTIEDAVEQLSL
jgi:DNA-binding transcriptional MerR regulator